MTAFRTGRPAAATAVYWGATVLVTAELGLGGAWDVMRLPAVSVVVERPGYPAYFLVILGVWKMLGAVALLVPRFPRLKEWAYAGAVFTCTGAIASHLTVGYGLGELALLIPLTVLTVVSWAMRPPSRRLPGGPGALTGRPAAVVRPESAPPRP